MTDKLGYVSIRNEDGTQWLCDICGIECWTPDYSERCAVSVATFERLQSEVEASKRNDCPDNGFFGMWNLTWHDAK